MSSLKIVIPILVVITIVVIIFNFTQNETIENEISQSNDSDKIEGLLEKIKNDKIKNDESENPYIPKEREWITSGPVKIDYSMYQLGQKIFVNIEQLSEKDEGQVVIYRPVNSTHHSMYHVMPFDGANQRNNYYLTPDLSVVRGICDKDDLIGNWRVSLPGTDYLDLEFEIIDSILPGYESRYEEVKCD